MAEQEDHDEVIRLGERVEILIEGQGVIFKKLDVLMDKKTDCPMGGTAHQNVLETLEKHDDRLEILEQQKAADTAQRKTLYLMIIGSLTAGGIVWGVITWVIDHMK